MIAVLGQANDSYDAVASNFSQRLLSQLENNASHTWDEEGNADGNNYYIPQTPEVGCVEECSGVLEFAKLVASKRRYPYV